MFSSKSTLFEKQKKIELEKKLEIVKEGLFTVNEETKKLDERVNKLSDYADEFRVKSPQKKGWCTII